MTPQKGKPGHDGPGRIVGRFLGSYFITILNRISTLIGGYPLGLARFVKRFRERKTQGLWTLKSSLAIDRAIIRIEDLERCES